MVEYARKGLIGLLTPQANTTVEPEFTILMPPGYAFLNARLVSDRTTIEGRLDDYFAGMADTVNQFANAPIGAYAFACTGASYLQGIAREAEAVKSIEDAKGRPFITAGRAVADALRLLSLARIGLISPYPPGLTEASVGYWRAHGFDVVTVASAYRADDSFHPIYSLSAASAQSALGEAFSADVDAFVLLGTGMPTLGPILSQAGSDGPFALSCMSALAWRSLAVFEPRLMEADGARGYLRGGGWRSRYEATQIKE
ncbi:MAG: hypothetical protein JSR72_21630 [Proteobacteria bacterium]|nr:hypothetical protein [Pseudomonadota bacterium]